MVVEGDRESSTRVRTSWSRNSRNTNHCLQEQQRQADTRENIADLGGSAIALDALRMAISKDPSSREDRRLNADTALLLNFARIWRGSTRPERLEVLLNATACAAQFRAIGARRTCPHSRRIRCKAGRRDGAWRRQAREDLVIRRYVRGRHRGAQAQPVRVGGPSGRCFRKGIGLRPSHTTPRLPGLRRSVV